MTSWLCAPHIHIHSPYCDSAPLFQKRVRFSMPRLFIRNSNSRRCNRIKCGSLNDNSTSSQPERSGIQLYRDIERLLTDTVKQSQDPWGTSKDWKEVEGAWVLGPRNTKPRMIVHFVGGIFVGAAPQLTYRLFLERLIEKDILVIATPYASGFDHFFIADEVQFKFDRCLRFLQETVQDLPIFGIGHSLGSVIHLLIGSRYAVQRSGNILMSFNNKVVIDEKRTPICVAWLKFWNDIQLLKLHFFFFSGSFLAIIEEVCDPMDLMQKFHYIETVYNCSQALQQKPCVEREASHAIPLFSPILVPMAQSIGPFLSQIATSPTVRLGAEMTLKQLETLSPPIMKQVLPLVEQLPPLYMDLINGRENFIPRPEETRRLIKSYYGISRNLLIKFKDDTIDETSVLAQLLSTDSAISSMLDMSIRSLPGDHGLPLHQALPDVPPAMTDAVNKSGELLANLTTGTPWETFAKEVGNTFGVDSNILRAEVSKELDLLVDLTTSWMVSNSGPRLCS